MVLSKQQNITTLLENFVASQEHLKMIFIYSREGLLISKAGEIFIENMNQEGQIDEIHGAISATVEGLLEKISMEYQIGNFGTGSFETPDHRIVFLESGPEAMMLCVCDYEINLNQFFPIAYLVAEKIAQLLEESFDFRYNSLDIPDLDIHKDFSLDLNIYLQNDTKQVIDGVTLKHHIKKAERIGKVFKLIVLGSAAVGKTTLINSFLKKESFLDYRPTLGINIAKQKYHIQGFKDDTINFLIYDLAGQEFFKRVRHQYYKGANCAFVVYDITRRETFDEAINFWFTDARKELGDIPFVLIGNKIDKEDEREVSREEGKRMAEKHNCFFSETSALNHINVHDTFKIIGIGLFFQTLSDKL